MENQTEIWKDVIGYEGYYQVSNNGKVKSLLSNKILKCRIKDNLYNYVGLYKKNKINNHYIHRLVAINFIHNHENKKTVNHKNGNKNDNRIENLEWATQSENNYHAYRCLGKKGSESGKFGELNKMSKKVYQYLNGELINTFGSTLEAQRKTQTSSSSISRVCNGKLKTAKGYFWSYNKKI